MKNIWKSSWIVAGLLALSACFTGIEEAPQQADAVEEAPEALLPASERASELLPGIAGWRVDSIDGESGRMVIQGLDAEGDELARFWLGDLHAEEDTPALELMMEAPQHATLTYDAEAGTFVAASSLDAEALALFEVVQQDVTIELTEGSSEAGEGEVAAFCPNCTSYRYAWTCWRTAPYYILACGMRWSCHPYCSQSCSHFCQWA